MSDVAWGSRRVLGFLIALTSAAAFAPGCHTPSPASGERGSAKPFRPISIAPASRERGAEARPFGERALGAPSTPVGAGIASGAGAGGLESRMAGCEARAIRSVPYDSSPRDSQIFRQVSDRLSHIRRFRPIADVPVLRVDPVRRRTLLAAELDCLQPEAAGHAFDLALMALGLLPWGFSSRSAMLELSSADDRGLYFVSLRAIAVPEELEDDALRSSLIHETAHAYQDRVYHLGDALVYRPGQSDRTAAYHSLAEGEALYLELSYQLGTSGRELPNPDEIEESLVRASQTIALPRLLKGAFVSPYSDGYRLVSHLHRLGGWPLVDAVWVRGLASTSELLHPERWIADGAPTGASPAPSPPSMGRPQPNGSDWTRGVDEALGEQVLRAVLGLASSEREDVRELASHYVDDRLTSFTREAEGASTVWQIRFGTRAAAIQAQTLLAKALLTGARITGPGGTCGRAGGAAVVSLAVVDRDIRVLGHGDPDSSDDRAWQAHCGELRNWPTGLL